LFNQSVPGPTLTAAPGPVAFTWTVPLSSIEINNYLVNVTSTDPNAQQQYVIDHNYTLPYLFQLDQIVPAHGLDVVQSADLRIASTFTEAATLATGVYLYGVVTPIPYSYDPSGEAGSGTGLQTGMVMGLWGVLWVSP
jgi:terminal oxidase subunit